MGLYRFLFLVRKYLDLFFSSDSEVDFFKYNFELRRSARMEGVVSKLGKWLNKLASRYLLMNDELQLIGEYLTHLIFSLILFLH